MKIVYLLVFDLLYFAFPYPIQTGNASNILVDLKYFYDKFRRILREVIKVPIESTNVEQFHPYNYRRSEILEKMTKEDLERGLKKHGSTLQPGALAMIKKKKEDTPDVQYFMELKGAPYWPGNERLYFRSIEPRYISPTATMSPGWTVGLTTLNPDCNQDCLKILFKRGQVCAQRILEKRKEMEYNFWLDLLSYLFITQLLGLNAYNYSDDDDHNYWEYRNFDDICDMEYENCRNRTHSWFPAYFGKCDNTNKNPRMYQGHFKTARHTNIYEGITIKQTLDFYEPTTGIWMLY